jgi:hypothetical protein
LNVNDEVVDDARKVFLLSIDRSFGVEERLYTQMGHFGSEKHLLFKVNLCRPCSVDREEYGLDKGFFAVKLNPTYILFSR